ncbi:MAG: 16S rRNA (adenine(1518)-N(6)/adenine(1519)-N(6))-dimethyltransferase RsmA [Tissierellia bacterium]|nr:16S rRNA (adenine(1518)-N(6)/adenine(1519)-N(6))-dimethyltransferase RsmA [Tissierellia bacterium]
MSKRLYQPSYVQEILQKYDFYFKKSLGQNFLIDGNIVGDIVEKSGIQEDDVVLEIGPGIGVLTEELSSKAKFVYSVEIDKNAVEILKDTLKDYDNIEIIPGDILKTDLKKIYEKNHQKLKVVANLPYYVTTPILAYLMEHKDDISQITVMIQKEVAQRIVSEKDSKQYSSLSVFLQYHSDPRILMDVPRTVFMPKPNVDSAVLELKLKEKRSDVPEDILFPLVRTAFNQRRKTILNSMTSGDLNLSKEELRDILKNLGISPKARAENLSVEDFINIAKGIAND